MTIAFSLKEVDTFLATTRDLKFNYVLKLEEDDCEDFKYFKKTPQ